MNLPGYFSKRIASRSVVLKPSLYPLQQVRRLEDRHVDVARVEDVAHQVFFGVLLVLVQRPPCVLRTQAVVAVEALDPAFGVLLGALHPLSRAAFQ
jgi:hypothetical protein